MSFSTILHKRNSQSGVIPSPEALSAGEIAINTADGKLFTKDTNDLVKTFLNKDQQPHTLDFTLSSINFQYGNNTVTGILAGVLGGIDNDVFGAGSTVINGSDNDIDADYAIIGNGSNNKILSSGDFGAILGGQNNSLNHQESFIIGSNISSHATNFTYVNNISATGKLYGDGSELTGIVAGGGSDVSGLSANWESTYTTVQTNSASWGLGGGEGTINRILIQENFSALKNNHYIVDTSSAPITGTLPASPTVGDSIFFKDPFLTWKTNNFTLNNNTNMIQGLNENIVCDVNGLGFNLTYIGSTVGWRIE